ncbi:MAG: hypothetical protein RL514_1998 [Verrucomicrobiota bacterium]|jgi:hypothetical protein
MISDPQRDIEQDLVAYKQRRREQAGAPLELHPATRKMLLSEAARSTSRPLLTSEEAAKNFVRSFVMSHQQPAFFARNKHRVIWAGAMFAGLAVVLAVLRNDPRQAEQKRLFTDSLPTPPPAAEPPPTPARPVVVASQPPAEVAQLVRDRRAVPAKAEPQQAAKFAAAPPASVATAPVPAMEREVLARRSAPGAAPKPSASALTTADGAASPAAPFGTMKSANVLTSDADKSLAEQPVAGEAKQLAKALKAAAASEVKAEVGVQRVADVAKAKVASDELKRPASGAGAGGGGGSVALALNPVAVTATPPLAGYVVAEPVSVRQRFQQLDNRAGYRQNFNSPPVPQVLQDFAFERTGDRVRIVDTDGSTYEGAVMPVPAEESRLKEAAKFDAAAKRKDASSQPAQSADPQTAYRFYATGLNRKLNQSVTFRGEWQPAAPTQVPQATPGLQPVVLGVRLERRAAEKQEQTVLSNSLSGNAAPTVNLIHQQSPSTAAPGRISGRAIVGGKNEFDINAVPK